MPWKHRLFKQCCHLLFKSKNCTFLSKLLLCKHILRFKQDNICTKYKYIFVYVIAFLPVASVHIRHSSCGVEFGFSPYIFTIQVHVFSTMLENLKQNNKTKMKTPPKEIVLTQKRRFSSSPKHVNQHKMNISIKSYFKSNNLATAFGTSLLTSEKQWRMAANLLYFLLKQGIHFPLQCAHCLLLVVRETGWQSTQVKAFQTT